MNAIVDTLILTLSLAMAYIGYRLVARSESEKRSDTRERLYRRMMLP